jgi:hypothetical protein
MAVHFYVPFARERNFLQTRLDPLKYALHLHRRPRTAAARRWNALCVEMSCGRQTPHRLCAPSLAAERLSLCRCYVQNDLLPHQPEALLHPDNRDRVPLAAGRRWYATLV